MTDEARLEANRARAARFGDPSEAGKKGAAKKEANALAQITRTRQALIASSEIAATTLRSILEDDTVRDSERIKAAISVLDRAGIGPHQTQDVNIGISLVETWAQELDTIGRTLEMKQASVIDVNPQVTPALTPPSANPPESVTDPALD